MSLALWLAAPAAAAAGPRRPDPSCDACLVVTEGGRTLYARRARARLPNASTTKMTTALLVADGAALDERVVVSAHAAATGGGGVDLAPGDSYTAEDLLYALLLSSSNDAAVALAEHVAGSEREFVAAMNDLAADVGARGTRFVTPHGLDAPGHVSTARDLALVAGLVLDDPVLARIVATRARRIDGPSGEVVVENRNLLLKTYRGAIGVKTGYTLGAGDVLVAAARRSGRTLIAVAMRADDAAADARALLDYGFARLARTVLVARGDDVGAVVLEPSGAVPVVAGRAVRGLAPPGAVDVSVDGSPSGGTVEAGERVGTVRVVYRGRTIGTAPAVAARDGGDAQTSLLARVLAAVVRALAAPWGRP